MKRNNTKRNRKQEIAAKFQKVKCFLRETWHLAKQIFGKHVYDVHYRDLAPIDNVAECAEHIKALEWAVSNSRVRNIAITGPYGSGKSSIINTFLRENPALKECSVRISLATFANKNNKPEELESSLSQNILQQLFYKVEQSKIPQSRYRKLYKVHLFPFGLSLSLVGLLSLLFMRIFNEEWYAEKEAKLIAFGATLGWQKYMSLGAFFAILILIIWFFAYLIKQGYSRLAIREIKVSDHAAIDATGDKETIFNKDLDEIVYFFEETGFRLVFFEDLDRFENPAIFVQLRELNTLLNNYDALHQTIVFVYAIKDDIFESTERTKFFDFILPVIPVINSTNSDEAFRHLLKSDKSFEISENFVKDIAPFISDMRVLQNIFNEFLLYRITLKTQQSLKLQDEPLMASVVLKNLYPKVFADLQAEKGLVKQAFTDKEDFICTKVESFQNEIQQIRSTLENIDQDCLKNIREIKIAMLYALANHNGIAISVEKVTAAYYSRENIWAGAILADDFDIQKLVEPGQWYVKLYSFAARNTEDHSADVPGICKEFIARIDYMKYAEKDRRKKLQSDSDSISRTIGQMSSMNLSSLLEMFGTEAVLTVDVRNNKLLTFLLRKGYIDEKYADYINFFKGTSISADEMNYIMSVKNQTPLPFGYSLSRIPQILDRMQISDFQEDASLNYDLADYLLGDENYKNIQKALLNKLVDESETSWNFINSFIDNTHHQEPFMELLLANWPEFWDYIYHNSLLTQERKQFYFQLFLKNGSIDVLQAQNANGTLRQFIEDSPDILQSIPSSLEEKMVSLIGVLGISFSSLEISNVSAKLLDCIFEGNHYELNLPMICTIITFKQPNLLALAEYSNYTAVLELDYNPLTQYILSQFENYTRQIVLADSNKTEALKAIESLLQTNADSADLCEEIICHLTFDVDNLECFCATQDSVQESIWDLLLQHDKVRPTWQNVNAYWMENELNQTLKDFLEKHTKALAASPIELLDDNLRREIMLSDISLDVFVRILPCLKMKDLDVPVQQVPKEKLEAMIVHHFLEFTPSIYADITKAAPDLCAEYILQNQRAFQGYLADMSLTAHVLEALIASKRMDQSVLEAAMQHADPDILTEKAARILCDLDIAVNRRIFAAIWELVDLQEPCLRLMFRNLKNLNLDDFDAYLPELGEPYCRLERSSARHKEYLPGSPENEALADRLLQVSFLTSYEIQTQTASTDNSEASFKTTLHCWVKAKPAAQAKVGAK